MFGREAEKSSFRKLRVWFGKIQKLIISYWERAGRNYWLRTVKQNRTTLFFLSCLFLGNIERGWNYYSKYLHLHASVGLQYCCFSNKTSLKTKLFIQLKSMLFLPVVVTGSWKRILRVILYLCPVLRQCGDKNSLIWVSCVLFVLLWNGPW